MGGEESKVTAIFEKIEERSIYISPLCSASSALRLLFACSLSGACLSVSCFQFSAPCSLSINRAQLSSDRANCAPRVGGLRSSEERTLARVIAYGAWCREVMSIHLMWESSSLLSTKICSALDVKTHLSR